MNSNVAMAERLLADLGVDAYVIDPCDAAPAEAAYIKTRPDDWGAFATPNARRFRDGSLRYRWRGDLAAIVFCEAPAILTPGEVLGVSIHEGAHVLDFAARPDIPSDQRHDLGWLRLATNLWHRACRMGYEIPLGAVVDLGRYGFDRSHLAPLLDEASRREGEPIESILAEAPAVPSRKRRRQPSGPRAMFAAGQLVLCHADGSVETAPKLDGRGGGRRFASLREFARASA